MADEPQRVTPTKSYAELRMETNMVRTVSWWHVFFIAAGVPSLVLFSMGGISALTGPVAVLAWSLSMLIGFIDCFIYAEIAGLHPRSPAAPRSTARPRGSATASTPHRCLSGVTGSHGARCLPSGPGSRAGYLLSIFFAPDASINTWNVTLVNLGFLKEGLELRINATFIIGAIILLAVWNIQHYGILRTARIQLILTIAGLLPLLLVTVIPILQGSVVTSNFSPFVPINGSWNHEGWTLFLGAMFIAAWSTYGFETAVCYMSEFKNPGKDMSKAIIWSGVFCMFVFILVPFVFQGVLGHQSDAGPGHLLWSGVGDALASMVHAGAFITKFLVVALVLTLAAGHHDGHVRLVADDLPGRSGRLAAQVPLPPEQAPHPDLRDVDRPRVQPDPPPHVGLRVRAGRLQRELPDLQLPQPQRGLDPPDRQRQGAAALQGPDAAVRRWAWPWPT